MKKRNIALALAGVATAALIGVVGIAQVSSPLVKVSIETPAKLENFRLVDHNSKTQELFYYKNSAAIVIASYSKDSDYSREAARALEALKAEYAAKDVAFLLLDSTLGDTELAVADVAKAQGLTIPVMIDDTQLIGESLGVSRVAQALVIEPKTWKVLYSGPIDDRFTGAAPKTGAAKTAFVKAALDATLSGKPVKAAATTLNSPEIAFPQRARKADHKNISYEKDVSPILAKNCVSCHTTGGIGPFAMTSYETVKAWAPMMRESIRTDRMPPYNADPHVNSFKGSMNLTAQEQQTLIHWIEAGAPRGDAKSADPLKVNAKTAPEWELGAPDMIVQLPSFKVPAEGVVDYQNPTVDNAMTEGRWMRASTINVGDRKAVHHLLSPIGGYAVGAETTVYPEEQGVWVEKGGKFRFQMHYTPYGKETTDATRVGVYFFPKDKPPTLIRRGAVIANIGIEIPPNTPRHEEVAYMTFPADATLYSIFPHAHYRGENAAFWLKKPGSDKEELILSLPKYDFNWQRGYEFANPISVPAGTKLITRYQYDNSKNNPANPDPSITVTWGEQSFEEMQYTAIGFRWNDETVANPKPEHMAAINNSRQMGLLDTNVDGFIQKEELRGRMGSMMKTNFDRLDANKDGKLSDAEINVVAGALGQRINAGAAQQSVGQ